MSGARYTREQPQVCPTCTTAGHESAVTEGGTGGWCIGWSPHKDVDGVRHEHDPNPKITQYTCSNGHAWHRIWWMPCSAPFCTYKKDSDEVVATEPKS